MTKNVAKPDYKKWTTLAGIFIAGGVFNAIISPPKIITKEVKIPEIRTEVKTVTQNVCEKESIWKELKSIDDKVITVSADVMSLCGKGIMAAANQDLKTMLSVSEEVSSSGEEIEKLSKQRLNIISKLGL